MLSSRVGGRVWGQTLTYTGDNVQYVTVYVEKQYGVPSISQELQTSDPSDQKSGNQEFRNVGTQKFTHSLGTYFSDGKSCFKIFKGFNSEKIRNIINRGNLKLITVCPHYGKFESSEKH